MQTFKWSFLLLSVFVVSSLEAQIIWNREEDGPQIDPLDLIVQTVLGKNYSLITKTDQQQLVQFLRDRNAQLIQPPSGNEARTFYLEFPVWLKEKYKTKIKFPAVAAIDVKEEVKNSRPKNSLWKKLNPQLGFGVSNSYTGEKSGGRRAETVQSDSLQLDLRGAYHHDGYFRFSLYPDFSVALNSSRQMSSYDLDFSTLASWDIDNRFYTSPVLGARYATSSHVYVNSSVAYVISDDVRYQMMLGGLTQWDFLERKWATLLLLNYTPALTMTRTSNTGGNLSGFGYEASLTTEFFKHFFLTVAFSYSEAKNAQIDLEKYRVNTLVFYPF